MAPRGPADYYYYDYYYYYKEQALELRHSKESQEMGTGAEPFEGILIGIGTEQSSSDILCLLSKAAPEPKFQKGQNQNSLCL